MSALDQIEAAAAAERLFVSGTLPAEPSDGLPARVKGIALLSPAEPGFWNHLRASPEGRDGAPDPIDRWSARVIGALAERFGATPLLPFGGPPWLPFISWAQRSGRARPSPVTLLVHDRMGLWCPYRGALGLTDPLPAAPAPDPCESCADKPCLTACPPRALTSDGYDIPACHAYLDSEPGQKCLTGGCRVRRACPVSSAYGRVDPQSAHHMRHFHK